MLFGDYMFNVECNSIIVVLMETTIFASMVRPPTDEGTQRGAHHSPAELARSWRAFDLRMATNVL